MIDSLAFRWEPGKVSVTDEGVSRVIGSRTHSLAWPEIQGLVPMPDGSVTLIAAPGKSDIAIPRFLDSYRACIAEIKDHSILVLPPPSSLRKKQTTTWKGMARNFAGTFFYLLTINPHESHRVRIASFCVAIAFMAWMVQEGRLELDEIAPRWIGLVATLAFIFYALRSMVLNW